MCCRLCLSTGLAGLKHRFDADAAPPKLAPHWNIAPGRPLPVVRIDVDTMRRRLDFMRWGLIPAWATTPNVVRTTISACGLDLEKLWRRCIVPVDSFYDWRLSDGQPFAVALASGQVMPLAGIWNWWTSPTGEKTLCVAILTTEACPLLQPVCREMPAILDADDWCLWLGSEITEGRALSDVIRTCPDQGLRLWPVHRRVRSRKCDDPSLLDATDISLGA